MGEDKKTKGEPEITGLEDTLDDTRPLPVFVFDKDGKLISPTTEETTDTTPDRLAFDPERTIPEAPGATLIIRNGTAKAASSTATPQPERKPRSVSPFEPGEIIAVGRKPTEEPPKASNSLKTAFAKENRENLFTKLELNQPKQELEIPPRRAATYLTVDTETLNDPKNHQSLADEIKVIAESREFPAIQDDDGNLIIIALSERGGVEKLFDIEESFRHTIPTAKMILGSCEVTNSGDGIFGFTDEHLDRETFRKFSPTVLTRVSKALTIKINDPDSRVGSNLNLTTEETDDSQFVRLIKAISTVSKEIGGPDVLIGYENEFNALYEAATDDKTGIISLEGAGGMGKSRLRTELLKKLPAHILCSANSADRTLPGASLVTLANQLIKTATEELDEESKEELLNIGILYSSTETEEDVDNSISWKQFNELPHSKRIEFVSKHPDAIAELCFEAMSKLREKKDPKTLFVFEDLHHVDHISEPHIIKLIQRYSEAKEGQPPGKVLVTSRPEEMYQSTNFKELKTNPETKASTKVIKIEGLDLLRNDKLGYNFAYHSLPPKLREGCRLGDWYRKLARKANKSPWAMKTFMDEVKTYDQSTDSYPNLIITDDNAIELKPEVLRRIEEIKDETDMANYFQERLAKLEEKPRKFLQYIALMNEKLNLWQAIQILENLLGMTREDILKTASELGAAGYTSDDKLRGDFCKLQHESTRAIVLDSIPDQKTKIAMAKELYDLFKEDETFNQKTRYTLASIIAGSMPPAINMPFEDAEFWFDYQQLLRTLFADAEYHHNTESSYELAATGLNLSMTQACISGLQTGRSEYRPMIENLAIEVLFNRAESARVMGKFDETDEAVKALQNIHAHFPEIVDIVKLYLISFDKAEMQNRQDEMKDTFEKIQKCGKPIPESTKIRMEIVIAHYEERYDDVAGIYKENKAILEGEAGNYARTHGSPSPTYLDLRRICETKAPLEQIRKKGGRIDNQEFDDDVTMQSGAYTEEDLRKIEAIAEKLETIDKAMKSHPLGQSPWTAIKTLEQKGTISACLGRHESAIKLYSEVWRIADQLGLNDAAARAAKLKSDVQVLQALLTDNSTMRQSRVASLRASQVSEANSTPDNKGHRIELLKVAIQTLSEEGIEKSLSKVDEGSDYHTILRIERIRAVGILTQELLAESKDKKALAEELKPYISTALEDFKYINKKSSGWAGLPFVQYYLMGYAGHILNAAHETDTRISEMMGPETNLYDNKEYPFMNLQFVESGLEYGNGMIDLDFGEVQRKLDGLHILAKALRRLEHAKAQRNRTERDAALASKPDFRRIPRIGTLLRTIGFDTDEAVVDEIEEYEPELIASAQNLKRIAIEILEESPANKDLMTAKITEACTVFTEANKRWPSLATNPETLYHITSYMGFIAQIAYNHDIPIDENIFDELSHPFIKLTDVKKAYEYAKRITDSEGEAARKSDSLSALIAILETKKHNRRRQDRKEKDTRILQERRKQ